MHRAAGLSGALRRGSERAGGGGGGGAGVIKKI
jgi:hypothetical protein